MKWINLQLFREKFKFLWNGIASHLERHVFSSGGEETRGVFKKEMEIIVYHCLSGEWKTKMGWLICLKTKQTAKSILIAFGYTFVVNIYSKQSAACENESYWLVCRCFNEILYDTSSPGISRQVHVSVM